MAAKDTGDEQLLSANDLKMAEMTSPAVTSDDSALPSSSGDVAADAAAASKQRVPKRILHFSDGTLEEYSTDEEDQDEADGSAPSESILRLRAIDPKTLKSLPWMWYWLRLAGYTSLWKVRALGESLSYSLGITSSKYHYELEQLTQMKQVEEEQRKLQEEKSAGWTDNDGDHVTATSQPDSSLITSQPIKTSSPQLS